MRRLLFVLVLLAAWPPTLYCASFPPGALAVVVDNGNNLRAFGGPGYAAAPILGVLDKGQAVTVLRQQGNWSEIATPDNRRGWINSACLVPAARYLADPRNSQDVSCPGDYPRQFTATLDPAHPGARIAVEDVPTLFGGSGRLAVADGSGRLLWRGPLPDVFRDPATADPLVYFCSPTGAFWPSVIGDVDGDGLAEIVANDPQSDVSVSTFTLARWTGQAFAVVRRHESLVETPPGSNRYRWTPPRDGFADARWIMGVKALHDDGTVTATVYEYGPNLPVRFGLARLRLDAQGATLLEWIEPLRES